VGYLRGLPRFARSNPARQRTTKLLANFSASLRSGPGGIRRASSKGSAARLSQSRCQAGAVFHVHRSAEFRCLDLSKSFDGKTLISAKLFRLSETLPHRESFAKDCLLGMADGPRTRKAARGVSRALNACMCRRNRARRARQTPGPRLPLWRQSWICSATRSSASVSAEFPDWLGEILVKFLDRAWHISSYLLLQRGPRLQKSIFSNPRMSWVAHLRDGKLDRKNTQSRLNSS